jgi:hypothetical protein
MSPNFAPSRADLKAARERAIFTRFAQAARPDIDQATIESREPPEPDIACATLGGERLAFEMAELCPPKSLRRSATISSAAAARPLYRRQIQHARSSERSSASTTRRASDPSISSSTRTAIL